LTGPSPSPAALAKPRVRSAAAKALGQGYDADVARALLTLLAQVPPVVLAHAAERVEMAEAERDLRDAEAERALLAESRRQAEEQFAQVFGRKPR
jgi:hypothetical protein